MTEKPNSVCKCGCPHDSHCFSDGTFKPYCDDCPCKAFEPVAEPAEPSAERVKDFDWQCDNCGFHDDPSIPGKPTICPKCGWNKWSETAAPQPVAGDESRKGFCLYCKCGKRIFFDESLNADNWRHFDGGSVACSQSKADFHWQCPTCAGREGTPKAIRKCAELVVTKPPLSNDLIVKLYEQNVANMTERFADILRPFITPACQNVEQLVDEIEQGILCAATLEDPLFTVENGDVIFTAEGRKQLAGLLATSTGHPPDFNTLDKAISDLGELAEMLREPQHQPTGFDLSIALRLDQITQTLKSVEPSPASTGEAHHPNCVTRAGYIAKYSNPDLRGKPCDCGTGEANGCQFPQKWSEDAFVLLAGLRHSVIWELAPEIVKEITRLVDEACKALSTPAPTSVPQAPKYECLYGPVGKHIFNPHDDEPRRCVNCGVPQAEPPK